MLTGQSHSLHSSCPRLIIPSNVLQYGARGPIPRRRRASRQGLGHTVDTNLRSQGNTLSPICHLPPEVLATIFIHCASDYHYLDRVDQLLELVTQACNAHVPSWVNVSYVCRYWRAVALDCPTLWAYHFVTSLRWTEELLARSQQASLKIRILLQYTESLWWSLVERLMNHTDRIQEFILHWVPKSRVDQIFHGVSSHAPRLQILQIEVDSRSVPSTSRWDSALFRGDTPALRTLDLSCCPVPWYSLKLSGLTTFSLYDAHYQFQQTMNIEEFLATLRCMQDLRCLYLSYVLAGCRKFISSGAFNSFQKIDLPHLSHLFIAAQLSTVIAFLSCVNIPLKTELRLESCSEDGSSLDDFALLSSLLGQRFNISEDRTLSIPTVRSLTIDVAQGGATFTFSTTERHRDNFGPEVSQLRKYWDYDVPLKINLHLGQSWSRRNESHIINNFFWTMPLTRVQCFRVISPPSSLVFWRKTLTRFQDLRHIELNDGNMPDLASVLSLTAHEDEETQDATGGRGSYSDPILVPHLEELELFRVRFSLGDSFVPMQAITQRCLFDALSTRNVPRGRLTMTQCWIGRCPYQVADVVRTWDGVEISRRDFARDSDWYED
ncbi:hypothetical protein OG21DRAFT_537565 [Imleria badia]|nr:hypothetical protein OG21DRAFT_537565 [Imleria badia]